MSEYTNRLSSSYLKWTEPDDPLVVTCPVSFPNGYSVDVQKIRLDTTEGGSLWFYATLSDHSAHEHQFVGLYDIEGEEFVRVLAACAMHHDLVAPLDVGHVFPFQMGPLFGRYLRGLCLDPSLLRGFFPTWPPGPDYLIDGRPTRILSVFLLTEPSYEIWKSGGAVAVLDEWESTDYDILGVRRE